MVSTGGKIVRKNMLITSKIGGDGQAIGDQQYEQFEKKVIQSFKQQQSPARKLKKKRPGHNPILDDLDHSKIVNNGQEFYEHAKFKQTNKGN